MFVVSDTISETLATALRNELKEGKTVLFAPTSAKAAETLGTLLEQSSLSAEEAAPRNYAMFGEIDFRHPLFVPFADPRFSDFTTIHFWKYRRVDPGKVPNARVVAKFDNGDPAILDIPVGKGRVVVFTSGWRPADSQLALSTKFVPLICSILELAGGTPAATTQFHVGDTLLLDPAQTAGIINFPDGSSLKLAAGETNFTQTTMPGVYQVKTGTNEKRFAVNLDPMESRTMPLPLDELDRLGAPVAKAPVSNVTSITNKKLWSQSTEVESRQKLWRWFIAATLGVLLLETGIAGWTARKQSARREAVA
jgi:hypothetical protein